MSLLTGALQIGRSALMAYQSALQVTGNNVSNAGSSTYTRQTALLSPSTGVILPEGFTPGGGVALESVKRNVDESLLNRLRASVGDQSQALIEQQTMSRIETVLQEWTENDLSTLMQEFFNRLSSLQNEPHEVTARSMVLTAADSVAQEIKRQRLDVLALRDELNNDLQEAAKRADELAGDIAKLNVRITEMESSNRGGANALRDQRDRLLGELAELMSIQVREQPGGSVNVYVGNEPLIQAGLSRGVTWTMDTIDGVPQVTIRFADNNGPISLGSGRMGGLASARDTLVMTQVEQLNGLARALINEVNKVHASGQGLTGYTDVIGTYGVDDATAALNATTAGLDLTPRNGSFLLTVVGHDGAPTTKLITVDLDGVGTDDSLSTLVDKINAAAGHVTASITADNKLSLAADAGYKMTFSQDTSNVLAALGVNTFFTGSDAQDLAVNELLARNPSLLAAATNNKVGDGSNAARLASLGTDSLSDLGGSSLMSYYNTIAADVAVKGAAAMASLEAADAITLSLSAQRESVSGVSLDEETIALMRMERAFQGAARFTAVVDEMIQEMLLLVG